MAIAAGGIWSELYGPGVAREFFGDLITVEEEEWEAIARAYPRGGLGAYVEGVMVGLCEGKPGTTWDNGVSDYGEVLVRGFNRTGHRGVDLVIVDG